MAPGEDRLNEEREENLVRLMDKVKNPKLEIGIEDEAVLVRKGSWGIQLNRRYTGVC